MNRLFAYWHAKSRAKKYQLFLAIMQPTVATRILNVGASGVHTALPEQLESSYPHLPQITGGGPFLPEVEDYRRSFPGTKGVVFDGCALPFADKSFDIVYSNAVLEHLPSRDLLQRFCAEVQRVGRGWFVTTPNFWYPIEPHYHLPGIQLLPQEAQRKLVRKLGKTPYDALHLLSRRDLRKLFPTSHVVGSRVTFYPETLIAYRVP